MRISVLHDASVSVVAPERTSNRFIERFVQEKRSWILEQQSKYRRKKRLVAPPQYSQGGYHACKGRAGRFIRDRLRHFAQLHGFSYNKLSIKNTLSQWGSCTPDGNLSFTYKLLFLPEELADYVIVHELCHLREQNHSVRFWKEVRQIIPDYKRRERKLKQYIL